MQLMHRLGSNLTDEYVKSYAELIEKHPGSGDNVWLATLYGFPPLDAHKEYADSLNHYAKYFRDIGMSISLQLSNSIGHGQYMASKDNTGLVYEGSPVQKMVGHDGTVANYCFCWRGKHFKEYLLTQLKYYTEALKPECIWVDDDYRAINHKPVEYGCFCDDCVGEFNRLYNSSFTRETLVEEILHGDISWREKYVKFVRDSLGELMYEMSKLVHKNSPATKMGYQYCWFGAYTGFGHDYIFDAMKKGTGHNPLSRPGGGVYNDHNPNEIMKKAVSINWQNSTLPDYVDRKCPEIENLPFCAFGKTPAGTAFETTYYMANGNTDMTYSMLMNANEPYEWYDKYFKLYTQHRVYWEKLSEYNLKSHQAGLQMYISKDSYKRKLKADEGFAQLQNEHFDELFLWTRDAIPVSYDRDDETVFVLHPECAAVLSDSDIEFLLKRNVLTDGESIKILVDKGFDLGINAYELPDVKVASLREKMTDDKINSGIKTWSSGGHVAGRNKKYYLESDRSDILVLAYYENTLPLEPYSEMKNYPYGIADIIADTNMGGKWAIFGYSPWKGVMSFGKREQLLNAADYICNNSLAARIKTPSQAVLLPRKDKNGKTLCVSVVNCTIGGSEEMEVIIRNPAGQNFSFMSQYNGSGRVEFEKRGNDYIVKIPSLNPWSVATVFTE